MIKGLGYIFIAVILGGVAYFFLTTPDFSNISLEGVTLEDDLFLGGEITPFEEGSIIENIKLLNFIKKEVSDLRTLVDKRKLECDTNAQDFFSRPKKELLDEKYVLKNIDYVFKMALPRKDAEKMFIKLREVIYADVTLKPGRIQDILKSFEICRSQELMDYLHQVLDGTKKYPKQLKKKITYKMIKNFNLILLGKQHSFSNIFQVVTYLAQMEELGLIKGKNENQIKDFKIELEKDELIYISRHRLIRNNKELIEYNKRYMERLNKLADNLKNILKSFGAK